mmetsp:Transcript_4742/g.13398  ORF Transcript_4742/g.13398 Transcript_4742/m.13398 type:complete len:322 (+) Transcript_4742:479-1444(+)
MQEGVPPSPVFASAAAAAAFSANSDASRSNSPDRPDAAMRLRRTSSAAMGSFRSTPRENDSPRVLLSAIVATSALHVEERGLGLSGRGVAIAISLRRRCREVLSPPPQEGGGGGYDAKGAHPPTDKVGSSIEKSKDASNPRSRMPPSTLSLVVASPPLLRRCCILSSASSKPCTMSSFAVPTPAPTKFAAIVHRLEFREVDGSDGEPPALRPLRSVSTGDLLVHAAESPRTAERWPAGTSIPASWRRDRMTCALVRGDTPSSFSFSLSSPSFTPWPFSPTVVDLLRSSSSSSPWLPDNGSSRPRSATPSSFSRFSDTCAME